MKLKYIYLKRQVSPVNEATESVAGIDSRVRAVEDWSRRKNLRITGMPELPDENFEKTTYAVNKLVNEKLEVSHVSLEKAFHLNRTCISGEPCLSLVQTQSDKDKIFCLKLS